MTDRQALYPLDYDVVTSSTWIGFRWRGGERFALITDEQLTESRW
jgi:hypothetical protein